eukprot:scaffold2.g7287.t1
MAHQAEVLVIGAGFAGLAAARALQVAGRRVVVLEAGHRPGGRAHTQRVSSALSLELGATWLHGLGTPDRPNPILSAAVEAGLSSAQPEPQRWWDSQFLLPGAATPLAGPQAVAVTRALADWQDAIDGLTPDSAGSAGQHLDEAWRKLEAHMQQQSVNDVSGCGGGRSAAGAAGAGDRGMPPAEAARRAWRWRERLERAIDGCRSTDDCSAAGLALYEEMERGVHVPLSCGFQAVAEWLAAPLDVRYGHAVETVAWGPSGVALACAGGVRLAAAAAVVTVSLGVLKAGCRGAGESGERSAELTGPAEPARPAGGRPLLRFEPPLPGWKLDAIERLRIGVVDKLIVEFGGEGEGGPADEAGVQAAVATSGQVPEATAAAAEGDELLGEQLQESGVQQQLRPGCSSAAAPAGGAGHERPLPAWARGVFSIRFGGPELKRPQGGALGPAAGGRGLAIIWLTGDEAVATEAASDGEILQAAQPRGRKLIQPIARAGLRTIAERFPAIRLPHGASWRRARVVGRSRWGADPLFRRGGPGGSYSYMGVDASPVDVAVLKAPLTAADAGQGPAAAGGGGPGQEGVGSGGVGTQAQQGASSTAAGAAPVLLIAGEACHVRHIGTMHGAFLTGQEAAQAWLVAQQAAC